jgi:hypothetical protein
MFDSHQSTGAPRPGVQAPVAPRPSSPMPGINAMPTIAKPKDDLSSLAIVDGPPTGTVPGSSKIRAFGVAGVVRDREFKRNSNVTGCCACHVKSFHGRVSDEGMERMDDKINDWLEAHPQYEVKFATTQIGLWDGKTKDLTLIVQIWY